MFVPQIGEYFGWEVATADLNGDRLDTLTHHIHVHTCTCTCMLCVNTNFQQLDSVLRNVQCMCVVSMDL